MKYEKTNEQQLAASQEEQNTGLAIINFEDDAGSGLEGTDRSSFAIPFLTVLQGLSPKLDTVEGARPGLFINTITDELFSVAQVIPCAYQRKFLRWGPRGTEQGGYKGEYNPVDVEVGNVPGMMTVQGEKFIEYYMGVPEGTTVFRDSKGKPLFDNLVDTRNHFVLVKSITGVWQQALISLSSTQIRNSKHWMSRIQGLEVIGSKGPYTPASYSHIYELKAIDEKKGENKWKGYGFNIIGPVTDSSLYNKAKTFNKAVGAGEVETQQPVDEVASMINEEVNQF